MFTLDWLPQALGLFALLQMMAIKMVIHDCGSTVSEAALVVWKPFVSIAVGTLICIHKERKAVLNRGDYQCWKLLLEARLNQ
jgi:hypothetical protein